MANRFVPQDRVAVFLEDDPTNIIYIRPRMDIGTKGMVQSSMLSINMQASSAMGIGNNGQTLRIDLGAHNVALLIHNIVGWVGPDFNGTLCLPENIKNLDDDDPLVDKVLAEINERNKPRAKDPLSSSASGKKGSKPTTAQETQAESLQASVQ